MRFRVIEFRQGIDVDLAALVDDSETEGTAGRRRIVRPKWGDDAETTLESGLIGGRDYDASKNRRVVVRVAV